MADIIADSTRNFRSAAKDWGNAAISLKLAGGLCVEQARCGKSWLQE